MQKIWFLAFLWWAGCSDAGTAEVSTPSCGVGTHDLDGICQPDVVCGPGTHAAGGTCQVDSPGSTSSQYEVRLPTQLIPADGFSKIPVLVIGSDDQGNPATDSVVLSTTVPGVGTLMPTVLKLTNVGATTYFTPCSPATNPSCLGTFQITMALASAPTVVIARSRPITLAEPAGVGSAAPCLGGGNVIFFDGDAGDWIFPGQTTLTEGTWGATASVGDTPNDIAIHSTPAMRTQGLWWDLEFSSRSLNQPLRTQVYEGAERAPFAAPGHPGIDIGGTGRGCNTITGRFQVHELSVVSSRLKSFTATFEQHCEGGASALRGCVHFEQ